MADTKISALPASTTPLAGTEVLPIVQSGATKQVSVGDLTKGRAVLALSLNASGGTSSAGGAANGIFRLDRSDGATNLGYITWVTTGDEMRYYNNNGGFHSFYNNSQGKLFTFGESFSADSKFYTGNLVQGTAAKGVNFTANTPAAGMTSQLLNWYEEGTFTPTISAFTGTITSATASGNYTRIGRQVTLNINIQIVTNGTGGAAIKVQGLPYNSAAVRYDCGVGREYSVTANAVTVVFSAADTLQIASYNGGYPGADGYKFAVSITYNV